MRRDPHLIEAYVARLRRPHWRGYLYQQLAFLGWSSLAWLASLRQPTLVLAGRDDPLVPVANARLLAMLIPRAKLELIEDGHLFLMSSPQRVTPMIRAFLLPASPAA